jgi:Fanconi anemia group M protein
LSFEALRVEPSKPRYVEMPLVRPGVVEDRLYQRLIAYMATRKNTLVVLPTALGKTVISALVTAYLYAQYRDKRILIMAPTRPLVLQHLETFKSILKIPSWSMAALTGKTPARLRAKTWKSQARIFFATPQVVKNDLEKGVLSLEDFCLLVFDECHRARKDYAYTAIARIYPQQCNWPLILGMTASPGSNLERIREICEALFIEQIEFRSEEDWDVKPYINPVKVEWRRVRLPKQYEKASQTLKLMLKERIDKLQAYGLIKKKPEHVGRRDLLELGEKLREQLETAQTETEKGPVYGTIILQSSALSILHLQELLETQGAKPALKFLEKIESSRRASYRNLINDPNYPALKEALLECLNHPHPKIGELRKVLEEQLKNSPDSRIIVFTQYRSTAVELLERLKGLAGIRAERFVGQASKFGDPGLTQQEQARILNQFREGIVNVLVATSIAEEGLDIPSVDLVVFYEPVPSEIRYIQRKGRTGRRRLGKAVILVADETVDKAYFYAMHKRAEKMRRITRKLNQQLKPILRRGEKPQPNPLSREEIEELEKLAESPPTLEAAKPEKPTPEIHVETVSLEKPAKPLEAEKPLLKPQPIQVKLPKPLDEEELAKQYVYSRLLEAGVQGILVEDLVEEAAEEGCKPSTTRQAIRKLLETGKIREIGWTRIAAKTPESQQENTYTIEVLKVEQGRAKVLVNDEIEAILQPEDYNGPRNLIKKYAKFKAKAQLYTNLGIQYVRISEVTEALNLNGWIPGES